MICAQDSPVHLNFENTPAIDARLPRMSEPCLKFWHKYTISPRLSPCQIGLANKRCWICHNTTQIICWKFSSAPELELNGSKSCSFARDQPCRCLIFWHSSSISPWHTILPDWIAKSAVHDLSKWDLWYMAYGHDFPVRLKVVALWIVSSFDADMCTWPQGSGPPENRSWRIIRRPSLHHSPNSTQDHYPKIGQPENL
jgi:hypothetical protein